MLHCSCPVHAPCQNEEETTLGRSVCMFDPLLVVDLPALEAHGASVAPAEVNRPMCWLTLACIMQSSCSAVRNGNAHNEFRTQCCGIQDIPTNRTRMLKQQRAIRTITSGQEPRRNQPTGFQTGRKSCGDAALGGVQLDGFGVRAAHMIRTDAS